MPKIPDPKTTSDFRPISISSPLLKLLETFVFKNWLKDLITEHFFSDQFAFIPLKGRGCQSALTLTYGKIIDLVSKGYYVNMVLIDFSKAFDTATSSKILNSLFEIGANKECLVWIYNFLNKRKQRVLSNDNYSQLSEVESGTPQGSIISPLLFACLLHKLKTSQPNTFIIKYADDTTLLQWSKDTDNCLQKELDNIVSWCNDHQLSINSTKTKIIHFSGKKQPRPPNVSINNIPLEIVKEAKLLGIMFSSSLKWNSHLDYILNRASKKLFILVLLKRASCNSAILVKVYYAFIRSILVYSIPTLCNMSKFLFNRLSKFEKRVCLIIKCKPSIDIKTFSDNLCKTFVKSIKDYDMHPFKHLLLCNYNATYHTTRSNNNFTVHCPNSSLVANSIIRFFI